jgi:hypothetical protein
MENGLSGVRPDHGLTASRRFALVLYSSRLSSRAVAMDASASTTCRALLRVHGGERGGGGEEGGGEEGRGFSFGDRGGGGGGMQGRRGKWVGYCVGPQESGAKCVRANATAEASGAEPPRGLERTARHAVRRQSLVNARS